MLKHIAVVIGALMMSACVTTTQTPFSKNISLEKETETRILIAIEYLRLDRTEEAISQLKRVLDKQPKSARVHEIMALAFEKTTEYEKANVHFKKMLKLNAEYSRGRSNYASYLIRRERYKEADKQLKLVVADNYYSGRAVVYWQLASIAKKLDQPEALMQEYLERAAGLDPSFANTHLSLASLYYQQKFYPKAYQALKKYRQYVKQSNAQSLLLGIKLARIFEDRNEEASYTLALKNIYPKSPEYLEYLKIER